MISRFSVSLFALLISFTAFSQFNIGAKAGANITRIEGKSFSDEFRYGYHLGGFMEIKVGNRLKLQPEVLFNQYATRVDSNFKNIYQNVFNPSHNSEIRLNYLSIPVLLNYKLAGPIWLQAGPQFGILIDKDKSLLQNGADAFRNGDLSMLGGAQIRLSALRITGRYAVGLSNINDIDNRDKWTSEGFQVSLGLAL
ncbi:MAG TPA: porin family protein [Chitinophagaceae bacterium]|nr:porin family protein [Chitinophagaceae bacterium]